MIMVLLYIVINFCGGWAIGSYVGDYSFKLANTARTRRERILIEIAAILLVTAASIGWAAKWQEWLL